MQQTFILNNKGQMVRTTPQVRTAPAYTQRGADFARIIRTAR